LLDRNAEFGLDTPMTESSSDREFRDANSRLNASFLALKSGGGSEAAQPLNRELFGAINRIPDLAGGVEIEVDLKAARGTILDDLVRCLAQNKPIINGFWSEDIPANHIVIPEWIREAASQGRFVLPLPYAFYSEGNHGSGHRASARRSLETLQFREDASVHPLSLGVMVAKPAPSVRHSFIPLEAIKQIAFTEIDESTAFTPVYEQSGDQLFLRTTGPVEHYLRYRTFAQNFKTTENFQPQTKAACENWFSYFGTTYGSPFKNMAVRLDPPTLFINDTPVSGRYNDNLKESFFRQAAGIETELIIPRNTPYPTNPQPSEEEWDAWENQNRRPRHSITTWEGSRMIIAQMKDYPIE
jgi:hypothetical protein